MGRGRMTTGRARGSRDGGGRWILIRVRHSTFSVLSITHLPYNSGIYTPSSARKQPAPSPSPRPSLPMDSFHEPHRAPEPISLDEVRAAVKSREEELRARGVQLSGRVLHVCHYLPITATLHSSSRPGILSPPATPPTQPSNIPPSPTEQLPSQQGLFSSSTAQPIEETACPTPKWSLAPRHGHSAMISGIRSLSATHEQLIIGWTGDIESPIPSSGTFSAYIS